MPSKSGGDKAKPAQGKLAPGLYVVATPIGNLGDITLRALDVLAGVDLIACEDTRVTGILKIRFGIATQLTPYHDHNAERVRPRLLGLLTAGGAIALVSDAGTPLISDPGFKLVRDAADAGVPVIPVPGASALLAAAVAAALPTDRIFFAGFLPHRGGPRRDFIARYTSLDATLVFYESPQRLARTLADLAAILGPRQAVICRELTKLHEELRRGTLASLAAAFEGEPTPKGEVVIVVAGAEATEAVREEDVDAALRAALAHHTLRDAATAVAAQFGQPRREIYRRALALGGGKSVAARDDDDEQP